MCFYSVAKVGRKHLLIMYKEEAFHPGSFVHWSESLR